MDLSIKGVVAKVYTIKCWDLDETAACFRQQLDLTASEM